jgi:hypothetical protein
VVTLITLSLKIFPITTLTATARKTHPGKFSPTLHKTGQYCKKIKGKLHNFGSGKKKPFNATLTGENSGIGV